MKVPIELCYLFQQELPNEKVDVDDGVSYSPLCSLASQNPYQDGSQYLEELEKV